MATNNIVNGTFFPTSTKYNIHFSCGFGDKDIIENLAQGSVVAISENQVFKRKCWRCHTEYEVKGLRYDDECTNPNCRQRTDQMLDEESGICVLEEPEEPAQPEPEEQQPSEGSDSGDGSNN